ncbi:MAG: 3D domain-containing protein [Pseudomonadota bacterium]
MKIKNLYIMLVATSCIILMFKNIFANETIDVKSKNKVTKAIIGAFIMDMQNDEGLDSNCLITAYYSPLPGQKKYLHGSYEEEIRINGEGQLCADNMTPPHFGVGAGPSEYPYGTKIFIANHGMITIKDRGSAIRGSHFDIWLGRGDGGRKNAQEWGARRLRCYVFPPEIQNSSFYSAIIRELESAELTIY